MPVDPELEATRFIGARVPRREDPRLLSGHGRYVDDVVRPGMLAAAFVRSPHARARIAAIWIDDAAALDGVRAVFTLADLATVGRVDGPPAARPLAQELACFVGDPVAVVVADSRAIAEDACELVRVDYEPLAAIVDPRAAVAADAELVHPELGSNVLARTTTPDDAQLDAAFGAAAHVFTGEVAQQRYVAAPMETRGVVASWDDAREEMEVWISTQGAHMARDHFAGVLGVAPPRVRVVVGDVGGAFGQKINVGREETAVVLASRRLGRPVKWVEDRWENLVSAPHARWEEATTSLALDGAGRIRAMRVDHLSDGGAYAGVAMGGAAPTTGVPMIVRLMAGPYRVEAVGGTSTTAATNTARRGAYRGPWMFETVVRELMVDVAARGLGLDPLELRRRNVIRPSDLPFRSAAGPVYDRITPAETLEQAVALAGYDAFRVEQARARVAGRYVGIGIACYIEPTASGFGMGITEAATIRIDTSGAVQVLTGVNSQGHSVETTLAQVAADHLGVAVDDVTVVHGDTAAAPVGAVTGGSRNAVFGGGAVRQSALELRERLLRIAAHALEASPDDLTIEHGTVSVRGTPTATRTFAELARLAYLQPAQLPEGVPPGLEVATRFSAPGPTYSNAAHVCTCEVDLTTGLVTLLRYVVSEDCGVVINPNVVEGQIAGGVVQGIGGALLERFVYDGAGNPLTTTFLDYLLPTAPETPEFAFGHVETPSERPGGFKGMGEGGAIGAPAAVVNAVNDALAPLGVQFLRQPLTPDAILAAVEAARARA